jgi:YbbR domain-containing protein
LEIKGAISEINKVTHATVEVDLAKLKQGITSAALNYKLWAGDTEIIDTTGLEYSPNGIVSLKVLRKKTVTVDAAGSLVGDVAKGYGVESAVSDPATIEIAGPENIIKDIESLRTTAINIDGATGTQSITTQVKLPPGVRAIYNNDTVDVTVTIRENKKTVTLDNLPVYITGLGEGLKVDAKFRATAVVTCSELAAPGIRASKIRLFVDATGMEAGSHTLTILYETADGLKVDEIRVNPTEIPVLIKAATAP